MSEYGEYLVTGARAYRGHPTGTRFTARLDPRAEQRAIRRGDIQLLRRVIPTIEPGTFTYPDGWLPATAVRSTEAPEGASFNERGVKRWLTQS